MKMRVFSLLALDLSAQSLTPPLNFSAIRSLVRISGLLQDILSSALPAENTRKASPKTISGRTSYYQARLAFHFLPQLIPEYCTAHGFGPPVDFRRPSPWPWQARLASGLSHFLKRAFNTWFPYAFAAEPLRQRKYENSLAHSSIGTPSPKHITSYVLGSDSL